ncbi:hypothetical protein Barb7_02434 [Bacteroidales bacterium Barb7]|nr:hypothetical protein Barb7_02434 [Bacteroidales bacterium Barb7]
MSEIVPRAVPFTTTDAPATVPKASLTVPVSTLCCWDISPFPLPAVVLPAANA